MSRYVFKLPDLGEGTVEAEIVGWRVKAGDAVSEDDVIVEVMTEKAAVELPAPVSGRVVSTTGAPGEMVPVGAELIVFETDAAAAAPAPEATAPEASPPAPEAPAPASHASASQPAPVIQRSTASRTNGAGAASMASERPGRVATSPAIRRKAHEAGIDLTQVSGSGTNGRILRQDLEAFVSSRSGPKLVRTKHPGQRIHEAEAATEEIKVIGVRRLIAQRMSESKRNIPHFAYVEELDVTELEALRQYLNSRLEAGSAALSYLPLIVSALILVLRDFPQCNALYDTDRGVIVRHRAVHVGIATQTAEGLKVPVVRDAQSLSLWDLAAQIRSVTEAARANKATREQLSGSTITITSLGKLGGIASTPIINAPEVAILGINRAVERPVVYEGAIAIRRMMNLSSSFDHRFVDGYDAAAMIQALKEHLEHPATIFIDR
ncbi:MAG: dihydrolipoamide acetyltransferase family protein [Steroidobacteraceae bacterium]